MIKIQENHQTKPDWLKIKIDIKDEYTLCIFNDKQLMSVLYYAIFIEKNCWDIDVTTLGKFNIYMYDGNLLLTQEEVEITNILEGLIVTQGDENILI